MKAIRRAGVRGAVVVAAMLASVGVALSSQETRGPEGLISVPRDLTKELANKTRGTYTVTAVGDVLMQEPMSKKMSPELLEVLRSADTTVGNMEVYMVDRRTWTQGFSNNWSPKEMARDYADMGFDMLVSGEGAGGEAGMRESLKYLDEVGIGLAGYGANAGIARTAVVQHTTKGTIALHASYPVTGNADWAGPGESYGLNPFRLTRVNVVTAPQLDQLRAIRDSVAKTRNEPVNDPPGRVTLMGTTYMAGAKTGEFHYDVNPEDRRAAILAVRNAKEYADFSMFSMHVHQNRYAFQAYSQDHYPAQYLIDLAHDLVDNGMDMYVGHGNHTFQGVELYKGRPIYYNLGNFSVHRFGLDDSGTQGPMTDIESGEEGNLWLQQAINQSAYVARHTYQDGVLQDIRLYPVDLGGAPGPDRRPWSWTDVPMTPKPARAREILAQIQEYSKPFGTPITIEVDQIGRPVGVIKVPAESIVPVGQQLRPSFGAGGGRGRGQPPPAGRGGRGGGQ
jgi:poly-gamma-glutamate synthesis protein (capsule biosynthesis protein)